MALTFRTDPIESGFVLIDESPELLHLGVLHPVETRLIGTEWQTGVRPSLITLREVPVNDQAHYFSAREIETHDEVASERARKVYPYEPRLQDGNGTEL